MAWLQESGVFEAQATAGAGAERGSVVTPFYDPMLALLIVLGADRADAIARARLEGCSHSCRMASAKSAECILAKPL